MAVLEPQLRLKEAAWGSWSSHTAMHVLVAVTSGRRCIFACCCGWSCWKKHVVHRGEQKAAFLFLAPCRQASYPAAQARSGGFGANLIQLAPFSRSRMPSSYTQDHLPGRLACGARRFWLVPGKFRDTLVRLAGNGVLGSAHRILLLANQRNFPCLATHPTHPRTATCPKQQSAPFRNETPLVGLLHVQAHDFLPV
jgi:hypothetical protein